MPSALKYIPPTDPERDEFSQQLISERMERRRRYETALRYYNGDHPEQLEYDEEVEPNDNTAINLVQITADRTASFLFPELPKFEVDPESVTDTPEEIWLKQLINDNGGLTFLVKLALRGFLAGHTFVRVLPPKRVGMRMTDPRFVLLDPLAITVFWSADDIGEVLWYENRYMVGSSLYIQDYVWRPEKGDRGEWEIYTYKSETDKFEFVQDVQQGPHGRGSLGRNSYIDFVAHGNFVLVPTEDGQKYARHSSHIPPIIEFPHLPHPDDYYGHGEVTQIELQDTINRLWSEINRIIRKHAEPVDVVTGADIDDVEAGRDVMTISAPEAKVQRLEMRSDLQAAVATVEKLVETYLAVARVVLLKGEAKDLQRVTNASVRTLFIDALAKNEILRHSYGRGLEKMMTLAMQMSGKEFAGRAVDLGVQIKWPEALPVDHTEIANINAIMVPLGARSLRTAATALGDNWSFEQMAIEAEAKQKLERMVREAQVLAAITPPEQPGAITPSNGGARAQIQNNMARAMSEVTKKTT